MAEEAENRESVRGESDAGQQEGRKVPELEEAHCTARPETRPVRRAVGLDTSLARPGEGPCGRQQVWAGGREESREVKVPGETSAGGRPLEKASSAGVGEGG